MRVKFKPSDLNLATPLVQSVANPQSTLPILSNVLISTEHENVVSLFATDFETRIKIEVPAEVTRKGNVALPAKTFGDLVRELPDDGEMILEARERGASITCAGMHAELACMPARDFPRVTDIDPTVTFDLSQRQLKRLIEKVLFAIPTRDPRKALVGALFNFRDGILETVATDGKILAFASEPVQSEFAPKKMNFIIHHRLLQELVKILGDEGNATVALNEKQVSFQVGNILVASNQIEATYPNFEAVVPKRFARDLVFQKGAMLSAIRRAAVMSDLKSNSVTLHFHGDTVTVEAESTDRGTLIDEIPAEVNGDDFRMVFNYKFVQEALKAIDKDSIALRVNQTATPAIFCGVDVMDNYYLVMPIKQADLRDNPVRPDDMEDDEESDDEAPMEE